MENLKFNDLKVSPEILRALEKMGFEEATPIQSQSINLILEGKDVTAQAPTGTGKTCAFGIPIIENIEKNNDNIQAVILCPTRELVIQMTEELKNVSEFKKDIKIVPIYGGQQIDRQIMALKRKPQIVVATPGRLMDHMRRRTVKLENLKVIILDEADEMLNMGFREDIDEILKTVPTDRQTVLFSATISKEIMEIMKKYQNDSVFVKVTHKELTVPTIEQLYVEVKGKGKTDALTSIIDTNNYKLCLAFCNTKRMVDELTSDLNARGYSAEALHGDMRQMQRDRVMSKYRKGLVDILVATDVAARGIDVENIEAVFNFDIPNDEEYYVHRIGRTGRANKTGVAYTFVSGKEIYKLRDIMRYTKSTIKPMKAPSISDVEDVRVGNIFNNLKDIIKNANLSRYVNYIDKLIEEEDTDITTMDIAAALLSVQLSGSFKANVNSETQKNSQMSEETGAESGMARIFINIGTLDKIRQRHIVEFIASNTSISGSDIGAIDIYDKYSFFEVPVINAKEVIDKLMGMTYKGRRVSVELANRKTRKRKR